MAEFIPFDPDVHFDEFRQMYIEWLSGQMDELKEKYGVDFLSSSGRRAPTALQWERK